MLRWTLLLFALMLLLLSALNLVRSPDWSDWRLGIVAAEFGHWLAVLSMVPVAFAVFRLSGGWRAALLVPSLLAAAAFLRPAVGAWRIGRHLPAGMDSAFGADPAAGPAFLWRRLVAGASIPSGAMRTEVFARPDGQELKLDFYPAAAGPRPPACVLVIHGGGWDSGSRAELPALDRRLAARGYAVAAIDYRLVPRWRWPAPEEDAMAALGWLKANAARLGIDPTRFVILGRSAGGQIAEVLAYRAHDPAIRGLISFYGPSDMVFAYEHAREDDILKSPALMRAYLGGPLDRERARYEDASALRLVGPGSPPTLQLHGELDALVWHRHSERLDAALQAAGVRHYFLSLPWATHAFDFNLDSPDGQLAAYAVERFVDAVTK